jgi:hypothetical protein
MVARPRSRVAEPRAPSAATQKEENGDQGDSDHRGVGRHRPGLRRPAPGPSAVGRWWEPADGDRPRAGWTPMVMDVDDDESVRTGRGHHPRGALPSRCRGRLRRMGARRPGGAHPRRRGQGSARDQLLGGGAGRPGGSADHASSGRAAGWCSSAPSAESIGIPFQAFYSASKFAMEGYGESLAYEVAPFGIHVTLVEPGNVQDRLHEQSSQCAIPTARTATRGGDHGGRPHGEGRGQRCRAGRRGRGRSRRC